MIKILTAPWVVALIGSLAYLGTTIVCFSTAKLGTLPNVAGANERLTAPVESWAFSNPEIDRMLEELRQEREALATREQQLKEFEARLAAERQEIHVVTDAVTRLQREFDQTILRIKQDDVASSKKLAKIYASMSPEGAANIIKGLPDDEVLRILFYLKPTESGPILEAFGRIGKTEAQRAATLGERLRRTTEVPSEKP